VSTDWIVLVWSTTHSSVSGYRVCSVPLYHVLLPLQLGFERLSTLA